MRCVIFVAMLCLAAVCSSTLSAGIPHYINYQGMLTDAEGNALSGEYILIFEIYDVQSGGTPLWGDTLFDVNVDQGLFNVIIGTYWNLNLPFDKPYWLGVRVDDENMPRVMLTSVGYAYRAAVADSAVVSGSGGGASSGWVDDGTRVTLETSGDSVGIGTATPAAKLDVSGGIKLSGRITSTLSTGTAPFSVSSSTKNDSLNADMVDGTHSSSFLQIRSQGIVDHGTSATIVIPPYLPWTLQLASGWPHYGGVCFVQGFENDWNIGITYIKYNGDGTSEAGGTEGHESSTATLVSFGSVSYVYSVKCPGEAVGDHNLVLTATGVELMYRLIY
jgi:hypothetical protein